MAGWAASSNSFLTDRRALIGPRPLAKQIQAHAIAKLKKERPGPKPVEMQILKVDYL
jgi:hypothetical protein